MLMTIAPELSPVPGTTVSRCLVKVLMNGWFQEVGIVSVLAPSVKMGKFKAQRV